MCQPLTSAEVYDFDADEWSSAGDLIQARGDGAMVEASGTIFSIGGEVNHPNQCAAPELVPPLAHQSLAVNDVEALEYSTIAGSDDSAEWDEVADIPEFRFRFSGASWPETGVAYAFGGQVSFDESCKCFPTTNEVTALDSKTLLPASGLSNTEKNGEEYVGTSVGSDAISNSGACAMGTMVVLFSAIVAALSLVMA